MRLLSRLSSVAAPARMQAQAGTPGPLSDFWYTPSGLLALGSEVSPDLALTLSYVYSAVSIISDDFGSMAAQMFRSMGEDGRARVRYADRGIGDLAYKLRWQPNSWQTAKAFWSTLAWQYLLRPAAYAEIVYQPGSRIEIQQIIPRHPDRVTQEVLPSGQIRFKLREPSREPRYVMSDEMVVVRNTSPDGLNAVSRTQYGSKALAAGLALQDFTKNYFSKGATAALLATYKGGQMEEESEAALHTSITRYLSGPENAGGLLLVPEDIDVKGLGVEPEKAQLLGLKNISGRDVARLFKMPPSWLGIEGAAAYASYVQDSQNYVNRCQIPLVTEFEQAVQRDLIVARDLFFLKFNMDYLLRGSTKERAEAYEIFIRSRVMRPSEARVKEDMSPDPDLDRLSEGDFRPGQSRRQEPADSSRNGANRAQLKGLLAVHDNAVRCLRRERHKVTELATKHKSDVEGWQTSLREFYAEHAGFVAQVMRVPMAVARGYAAQHGAQLEATGIGLFTEVWERDEADELCALALDDGRIAA